MKTASSIHRHNPSFDFVRAFHTILWRFDGPVPGVMAVTSLLCAIDILKIWKQFQKHGTPRKSKASGFSMPQLAESKVCWFLLVAVGFEAPRA